LEVAEENAEGVADSAVGLAGLLEEFLAEALDTMSRLAHQVTQLRDHIEELEGKTD
jgi:methyl-accepting chemotaxis protein